MLKKKLKINKILREQNLKRHSKIKIQDHRPRIIKEVLWPQEWQALK